LVLLLVVAEAKVFGSDFMYAHVFRLLPTGTLRVIPVIALLLVIGSTVWGAVNLARIIKGRQPRMPDWSEEDFQNSETVASYTITPPFRDEPARVSLRITDWDSPHPINSPTERPERPQI
jgi:hypothetical protein